MSAIATAITTTSSTGVDEKEYHQTTIDIMTTSVAPPPISPPYVRLSTQQVPNPVGRRGGSRIKHSPRALHHKHERSSEEEGTSSSGLLQPPSSPRYLQATIASSGVLHNSVADSTWCRYALASNTTPDASGTATTTTTPHEPLRPWLRNHESPAIVWNERRVLDAYPVSGGGTTPRFEHSSAGTPQRGLPQSLRVFRVSGADRPGTCAAFGSASARVLGWSNHSSYDTPTTPQSGGRPASHIKPSSAATTLLRTSLRQRAPRPPSPPCLTPTLTSLKRNARDLRTAQKEATRLSNEHCQHVAADDGDDSAVVSSSGTGNDAHQQEVGGHPHTSSVVKDAAPHSSGRLPPQAEGFLHAMSDVFARALHHHQLESRRALLLLADNYEGRLKNAEQPATTTLSSPSRGHRTNAATTSLPTPRSTAAARRLGSASSTKS